ncbi:hypothetical protein T35B1_04858 [Salinisphaera shabanensis T35B1]|uniref:hypothetical protein n=1 Tax=Salinisphaera shabanensis TaxID=180542 RepID=UPI003340E162
MSDQSPIERAINPYINSNDENGKRAQAAIAALEIVHAFAASTQSEAQLRQAISRLPEYADEIQKTLDKHKQ